MTTGALPPFSPLDPNLRADPYPLYRRYRERERVHVGEAMWRGGPPTVYLFGFAEVVTALRDDRLRREGWRLLADAETPPQPAPDTFGSLTQNWMLFRDPLPTPACACSPTPHLPPSASRPGAQQSRRWRSSRATR